MIVQRVIGCRRAALVATVVCIGIYLGHGNCPCKGEKELYSVLAIVPQAVADCQSYFLCKK